jgi:hypothetical protein
MAPMATIWITFQLQAASQNSGEYTAPDMWTGLFLAVLIAFFTSFAFSEVRFRVLWM